MGIIEEGAEDFAKESLEQGGKEAVEQALKDAVETVDKAVASLEESTNINKNMLDQLEHADGAVAGDLKETMNNIISKASVDLPETINSTVKSDVEAATKEANEAVEAAGKTLSDADKKAIADETFTKAKFQNGKLAGTVLKYSAFAAVAILMVAKVFTKLNKAYPVTQITYSQDKSKIYFTIDNGDPFCNKDSFTFSYGTGSYVSLDKKVVTVTDQCGPAYISIDASQFTTIPPLSSGSGRFTVMTCSPSMEGNLLHSTGEDLNGMIELANNAAKTAGNDVLGDLGLSGLMKSFKWIILGAGIIFVLILLLWIYKQFKG